MFIIAEAGVNHNGSVETALRMVDAAVEAGADAVKFQTFRAENVVARDAPKAEYQKTATGSGETQFEMIRKLELDAEAHARLKEHCARKGIMFLSTPFDLASIDLLLGLGLEIFKIPSGEITNLPYLRKIGSLGKRVIMSTGMATMDEVKEALAVLTDSGTEGGNITLLHANTEYPTPFEDVNLRAMLTLRDTLKTQVGYSDHTEGIEAALAAVALGASVIEKHFTLDKAIPGPDHAASLKPEELGAMVRAIRNIEKSMGDGLKRPSPSELKNIPVARKSIVAARAIKKGEKFSKENLAVKRPGTGLSPMKWDEILGRTAKRDFKEDEAVEL